MEYPGEQPLQLFSKELEQSVLGTILVLPYSAEEQPLEPEDFYLRSHQHIFRAFSKIREENEVPDTAGIINELEQNGRLKEVGGAAYITQLLATFITDQGLGHNVKSLKNYRARRVVIDQAQWMVNKAMDFEVDIGYIQDQVILAMSKNITSIHQSRPIGDVVSDVYDDTLEAVRNPNLIWGMETPFWDFNTVTGGIHKAETLYIAGPPGAGKSILANQIGLHIAKKHPVWLVSLEMRDKRLIKRILSAHGEIPTRNINTGFLDDDEWLKFTQACEAISDRNVHIWDRRGLTLSQFRAEGARLVRQFGIELIILDYLFLLAGYDNLDMVPRTETLSNGVLRVAEQLDVAVICINSVVKEGMKGYSASLSDMRGSGQLLHDGDTICFIDKAKKKLQDYEDGKGLRIRDLTFKKIRDGDMEDDKKIQLGLTQGFPKFVSMAKQPDQIDQLTKNLEALDFNQGTMGWIHD